MALTPRRLLAAICAFALAVALAPPLAGAGDAPTVTVTVTPSTGLLDRHRVAVEGSGFAPGQGLVVVDCAAAGCVDPRAYGWTIGTPPATRPYSRMYDPRRFTTADPQGWAWTLITSLRTITVGDLTDEVPDVDVDCSASPCWLEIRSADWTTALDTRSVSFLPAGTFTWPELQAAAGPPPPPYHRTPLRVSASGFDPLHPNPNDPYGPKGQVRIETCAAPGGPCVWQPASTAGLDSDEVSALLPVAQLLEPDGTLATTVDADRFPRLGPTTFRDCAVDACHVRVVQAGLARSVPVPMTFGPVWRPFASARALVDHLSTWVGEGLVPVDERATLAQDLASGQIDLPILLYVVANHRTAAGDVATLYSTLAARRPDLGGLDFWIERIRGGRTTIARVAETFAATPEIRAAHASLDDAATVDWAYQRTLGRSPDPAGRTYWVDRLGSGLTRARMLASMALASESRDRTRHQRIIASAAAALADRVPTAADWAASAPGAAVDGLRVRLWVLIAAAPTFRRAP